MSARSPYTQLWRDVSVASHHRVVPGSLSNGEVPEDIRPFVRRQAVEITDTRWDYDIGLLIKSIEGSLMESPKRKKFLAEAPSWDSEAGWQFIMDDPPDEH
jgi:hypothetical protein